MTDGDRQEMTKTPEAEQPNHDGASTTPTPPGKRSRKASWLFALLIPVCAIAPWAVPWPWQQVQAQTSSPSSFIEQAGRAQDEAKSKKDSAGTEPPSLESVKKLRDDLAASAGEGYDLPVTAKELASVSTTPGRYQKLGRVTIPAIGLDVTFGEGVDPKTLEKGPGQWPGTPTPGDLGTAVLSGHRNTNTQPFKELDELKPGDKVVVTMTGKAPVTFRVIDTTIVPEAKYSEFVLKPAKDPTTRGLTLFACHPEGNPIFRIVVRTAVEK
jgi:sortase A